MTSHKTRGARNQRTSQSSSQSKQTNTLSARSKGAKKHHGSASSGRSAGREIAKKKKASEADKRLLRLNPTDTGKEVTAERIKKKRENWNGSSHKKSASRPSSSSSNAKNRTTSSSFASHRRHRNTKSENAKHHHDANQLDSSRNDREDDTSLKRGMSFGSSRTKSSSTSKVTSVASKSNKQKRKRHNRHAKRTNPKNNSRRASTSTNMASSASSKPRSGRHDEKRQRRKNALATKSSKPTKSQNSQNDGVRGMAANARSAGSKDPSTGLPIARRKNQGKSQYRKRLRELQKNKTAHQTKQSAAWPSVVKKENSSSARRRSADEPNEPNENKYVPSDHSGSPSHRILNRVKERKKSDSESRKKSSSQTNSVSYRAKGVKSDNNRDISRDRENPEGTKKQSKGKGRYRHSSCKQRYSKEKKVKKVVSATSSSSETNKSSKKPRTQSASLKTTEAETTSRHQREDRNNGRSKSEKGNASAHNERSSRKPQNKAANDTRPQRNKAKHSTTDKQRTPYDSSKSLRDGHLSRSSKLYPNANNHSRTSKKSMRSISYSSRPPKGHSKPPSLQIRDVSSSLVNSFASSKKSSTSAAHTQQPSEDFHTRKSHSSRRKKRSANKLASNSMEKEMQQLQQRGRKTPSSASYKTISSTSGRGSGMRSPSNVTSSTRISTKRSSDSISRTPTSRHRSHHYNDRRRHRKRASVDQSGRGLSLNDHNSSARSTTASSRMRGSTKQHSNQRDVKEKYLGSNERKQMKTLNKRRRNIKEKRGTSTSESEKGKPTKKTHRKRRRASKHSRRSTENALNDSNGKQIAKGAHVGS